MTTETYGPLCVLAGFVVAMGCVTVKAAPVAVVLVLLVACLCARHFARYAGRR